MRAFMVDNGNTLDRDDAFAVARTAHGWHVDVAVASPADLVAAGSPEDLAAAAQGSTHYQGTSAIRPMLGRAIETRATLSDREPRNAILVAIDLNESLNFRSVALRRELLAAGDCVVLSHGDANAALRSTDSLYHAELTAADDLSRQLFTRRSVTGSLALYDISRGVATTEDGAIVNIPQSERNPIAISVIELMILANTAVAHWAIDHEVPVLFRNQRPNPVAAPPDTASANITAALDSGDDTLIARTAHTINATTGKVHYAPTVEGHHGLGLAAYTHFTSPLRRYPDLVNQRMILARLDGVPSPYTSAALREIGEQINARDFDVHDQQLAFARSADETDVRRALRTNLSGLPAKRWSKVLELSTRSKLVDNVDAELRSRVQRDLVGVFDLVALASTTMPSWADVRAFAFEAMRDRHPEFGPSVVAGLRNRRPTLEVAAQTQQSGPLHRPVFAVRLSTNTGQVSGWSVAATKKRAAQFANWALLAVLMGEESSASPDDEPVFFPAATVVLEDPPVDLTDPNDPTRGPQRLKNRERAMRNPVSWLDSFAKNTGSDGPSFDIESVGQAHDLVYVCTARVGDQSATGSASTKRASRIAAATALVSLLFA